jgi:hypothetical protein
LHYRSGKAASDFSLSVSVNDWSDPSGRESAEGCYEPTM